MLEILPKVDDAAPPEACRGVLLNLLRESRAFPTFRHLSASHHLRNAPLLEVFIAAFFEEVTVIVRGGFALRPDIVLRRGTEVVAVLDTKWKKLRGQPDEEFGVSSADAYQMHAYASAYGCHDVRLLYLCHSGLLGFAGHIYELATTGTTKPLLRLGFVDANRSPLMLVGVDLDQKG